MVSRLDAVTGPVRPTPRRRLAAALGIGLLLGTIGCDEPVDQLIAQAAAMREAGDFRAAASTLDAALAKQPKNIEARLLAAQIYIDLRHRSISTSNGATRRSDC
jgi:thioredoxin-like negative regulator of GroEL